ncbi:sensor histidine kinase [Rufibacter roseolus]|uniref:sensor histidine kinase n=1 Tax=Rufibacter roseolus TaxID=2817375 RepID=UPI001B3027EE|nr:histidine kinase [Rufibacter roseolus]
MSHFAVPRLQLKSILRWILIFSGLALVNVLLQCASCLTDRSWVVHNFGYAFVLCSSLWLGNGYLGNALNQVVSWVDHPVRRFGVTSLATTLYSAVAIFLVNWAYFVGVRGHAPALLLTPGLRSTMLTQMLVTFFITLSLHAVSFLRHWRQSAIDTERLKKEHALSQYEALKNQVNPHFLFNSLNALTSLVHPQPDLAVKFIKQLSEVYRYVLDSQHKEVVPLEEELHFTRRYVFLQQIRHAEGLDVQFPTSFPAGFHLPPLALQMLLENAIKHNRLWAREPLRISISIAQNWLIVENNRQPKPQHEPPSGLGLANIQARYQMLTHRKPEIVSTDATFTVRLPLLSFQERET